VEGFLRDSFARVPARWRAERNDDLLSLADVDTILTGSGLRRPSIRLVRDGVVLDPATWTRRARTGSVWVDDVIHPGKVLDHFAAGATIALQGLHRWWPDLTILCRQLEIELGHPVQANAYLTPAGAAGLAPHHDTHDVFVLQVSGTKSWIVREPVLAAPLPRQRSDHDEAGRQPVLFEADLQPGDCLYLPRGFVHSARAQSGVSLHLTLGVLATTASDVLRRLVDATAEDPLFRRTMPAGFGTDPAVATEAVKEVVTQFLGWLSHVDAGEVARGLVRSFGANRQPLLAGQLHEVARLDRLDDDTAVTLRPGTVWHLDLAGDRMTVTTGDRTIELPAVLEVAVRRLLDGDAATVGSLSDLLDEPSRLVLVRRLVREGLLRTSGVAA
jgi:mannose-6-phosphate isomerase-like protein (cupin superfamily)